MKVFALFKYHWLLQQLIIRDLKIKYRRSILGYFWSILNPILMMAVTTVAFSYMFRFNIENYPVYILTGQLIFNYFSEATNFSLVSILMGSALIKKVALPKSIFPVSRILSSFVTMLLSMAALMVVMVATGASFHFTTVMLPVFLLYFLMFVFGVGFILSTATVFFRDLEHLYGVVLSALHFLTPVFYPVDLLPPWLQQIMVLNPLYNYINMFRNIMIYGNWPTLTEHFLCLGFGLVSLFIGLYCFTKYEDDFILYI